MNINKLPIIATEILFLTTEADNTRTQFQANRELSHQLTTPFYSVLISSETGEDIILSVSY